MSEEFEEITTDLYELRQMAYGKGQYDTRPYNLYKRIDTYLENLYKQNTKLKAKYNKVLTMLANHYPPCELDGFMDKNTDYCSMNCSVDEEVFKECWNRYIDQELKED